MLLLAAVLAVGIGSALMYAVSLSSISQVRAAVNEAHSWASLIRLAIIGGVAALWGPVVRRLHVGNRLCEGSAHEWLALRWQVVLWLLLLELFIGQNLIGQLMTALSGTAA